jgi:deoxyribodipyrimidine photo-lyase
MARFREKRGLNRRLAGNGLMLGRSTVPNSINGIDREPLLCDHPQCVTRTDIRDPEMSQSRARLINEGRPASGPVVYWMSREQRPTDNWALHHAQDIALARSEPLLIVFCLVPRFLGATVRQYGFLLRGLRETEQTLSRFAIPFVLLRGKPSSELPVFLEEMDASLLVTDFDPLRVKQKWKRSVARRVSIPVWEVDAHNVIPCWVLSDKQEYGAFTIRKKIDILIEDYLPDLPGIAKHTHRLRKSLPRVQWKKVMNDLQVDKDVPEVDWITPGPKAAIRSMLEFINERLPHYEEDRNDPNLHGQSDLSPYLHFGHLSPQRLAIEVSNSPAPAPAKKALLEELIVRRELSDNFCYYNPDYDSVNGFPEWARKTLDAHRGDERAYVYSRRVFERGRTHDDLWNAAQLQMVQRGKMHGYMRMYWAKKILQWSKTPEEAMKTAIYLNDRYELDGRDPNGYAGIAWSIGGVHDRPWPERPVFGKIRYMSREGCKRKFNIQRYIDGIKEYV